MIDFAIASFFDKQTKKVTLIFNVSSRVHVQILTPFDSEMREIFDVTEKEGSATNVWVHDSYDSIPIFKL